MSEVRLNLIDARNAIHGTIHGSVGDAVIAALSAEPETIAELESALERFNKRIDDHSPFAFFAEGEDTRPWDAGVVIVDLAARIVASESSYSAPEAQGAITYHDGNGAPDVWLRYRIPDNWLFLTSVLEYDGLRSKRRAARMSKPLIDIRKVLYGRPLFEFMIAEWTAENARFSSIENEKSSTELTGQPALKDGDDDEDSSLFAAVLRAVHSRWLMTSRKDLGGRTTREVILEKRDFITCDIEDRAMQWSLLNEAPPPLSRDSHAYRFAGFGNHEYVVYYDFVRTMLMRCWERLSKELSDKLAKAEVQSAAAGSIDTRSGPAEELDQRVSMVTWLEEVGSAWLNSPNEDFGRIPAAIIESERRRIPLVMSSREMIVDEDCELCQMLANETGHSGPTFWFLDGSSIDQEFEFSTYATREEWEAEERYWRVFNEEFESKRSAAEAAGLEDKDSG